MNYKPFIFIIVSILTLSGKVYSQDTITKPIYKILFVGNSLTYTNNLPKIVENKALEKGLTIQTKMIAKPNYAIIDHWREENVQKEINSMQYDFVIIQQGPSSQIEGRNMLIDDGKKYSLLCKKNNAKLCYLMVWPSLKYYDSFDGVIKNHTDAANINDAILIPAGKIWKEYISETKKYHYYGADRFHPSLKGSEKVAEVIINTLF